MGPLPLFLPAAGAAEAAAFPLGSSASCKQDSKEVMNEWLVEAV